MKTKKHYAVKYKERIWQLENIIAQYYDAVYEAKMAVKDRNGLKATPVYCGRNQLCGNEERMPVKTYEGVCEIIENLPLLDGGIT
ncbi:MAG: hypothetical protein PHH26_00565 [Candidatus Thermoplasmatota archaeon]|nr:hypothetical protein [Candidatus Thermoplasmatota archaeon]